MPKLMDGSQLELKAVKSLISMKSRISMNSLMSVTEAARHFKVNRLALYRRINDGSLRAYKSALDRRAMLVSLQDVEELLQPQVVTPKGGSGNDETANCDVEGSR